MSFLNQHSYLLAALAALAGGLALLKPHQGWTRGLAYTALILLLVAGYFLLRPRSSAAVVTLGDGQPTGLFLYSKY